jgi:hypothetical protein
MARTINRTATVRKARKSLRYSRRTTQENGNQQRSACLWSVVSGDLQFDDLPDVRVQFLQTARARRTYSAFAAFIVALFVEMYGFPLSIYLMSGWLQTRYPSLDLLSHNTGHLWSTLSGEKVDPHFGPLHIASYVFLGFGFYLLSSAWNVLYHAQRRKSVATTGPYARFRMPTSQGQFVGRRAQHSGANDGVRKLFTPPHANPPTATPQRARTR